MPKITKRVHYRRFDPNHEGWVKGTLQSMLVAALSRRVPSGLTVYEDWSARTLPVPGEPQLKRFAHNITSAATDIAGTMCLFSPNDWAPVLIREGAYGTHKSLDEALRAVEIAERPPLDGEDYLRGIAYWLIAGNHLFVVQHTSIQTKAFEEYFKALFDATGITTEKETFALKAVFNKTVVGGDLEEIMAVEVGGILSQGMPEIIASRRRWAGRPAGSKRPLTF